MFRVKIFNPVPSFFLFRRLNFAFLAIVSSGSNFTSLSSSNGGIGGNSSSSKYKSIGNFSGVIYNLIIFFWAFLILSYCVLYISRSLSYKS